MFNNIKVLTFGKGNFIEPAIKLKAHINSFGIYNVIELTDSDLPKEFKENYSEILANKKGYGYCIWKPYIILEQLLKLKDDEILIYIDSTDVPNLSFFEYVLEHFATKDILLVNRGYMHDNWTRRDTFVLMNCDSPEFHNQIQLEAGVIAIKKNDFNVSLITEWFNYCKNNQILCELPQISGLPNYSPFYEHRYDQSILTNLQIKYKISHIKLPDHMIWYNFNQPNTY